MSLLEISVTQEHIDKGLAGIPQSCALANAISGVIGEDVWVGIWNAGRVHGALWSEWELDPDARLFVEAFDAGRAEPTVVHIHTQRA